MNMQWIPRLMLAAGIVFSVLSGAALPPELLKIAAETTTARFPDADFAVLREKEYVKYEKDGTYRYSDDSVIKILTESGRKENRVQRYFFNTHYSRIADLKISVVKKDGSVHPVDLTKNSRVSVNAGQMASNIYDPASKNLSVSVSGLEIGDLLWTRVTEEIFKPLIPGAWSSVTLLQSTVPILENRFEVDAPAELPLRAIAVKDPVKGTVSFRKKQEGKRILYTWVARNVPQIFREPGMPELSGCAQRLLVSTVKDWPEISRWYWNLCRPRLDAVSEPLRQQTAALTQGKKSDMEKVRAIFRFVSQKIRYMGITPEKEAPGFEPHDVKLTFQQRYGVCRDKAALLAAMLEIAGFKAYPVLFMAGTPKDPEIPNTYFNHAVTAVELTPGEYTLMDPTYESSVDMFPAFNADMSYLVAHPKGEKLRRSPVIPAEKNRVVIKTAGNLDGFGVLHCKSVIEFSGVNDIYYRGALSRWPEELVDQVLSGRLKKAVPGAWLESYKVEPENIRDMSKPLRFTLQYSTVALTYDRGEQLLTVPFLGSRFGIAEVLFGDAGLILRRLPLKLMCCCRSDEEFTITLPENCRISVLPNPRNFGVGEKIRWDSRMVLNGNQLRGTRSFAANALEITAPEYAALRSALHSAGRSDDFPLAVRDFSAVPANRAAVNFPGSDSIIENWEDDVELKNGREWKVRSRMRRKILNYAGVKAHSEIRILFNPVWEKVSVKASVIDPRGNEHKISPAEINLMDSPWCASAPRYPGGKIMVVSLPGVVPGSVIVSEIERSCADRNFCSLSFPFCSFQAPVQKRTLRVTSPESLRLKIDDAPGIYMGERSAKGRTIRLWKGENFIRIPRELNQPDWHFFVPGVRLSLTEYGKSLKLLNARLTALAGQDSPELKAAVDSLKLPEKASLTEKLQAVRDYVHKNVRSAGPDFTELPLDRISAQEETLKAGYGNSADRAVLTGAMLRVLGIPCHYIGTGNWGCCHRVMKKLTSCPSISRMIPDILVHVPKNGVYLNDTGRYALMGSCAHEGMIGVELSSGRLIAVQSALQKESSERVRYVINCREDGSAELQVTRELNGTLFEAAHEQLATATPERRRRFFEKLAMEASPGAILTGVPSFDFKRSPGVLNYTLKIPEFFNGKSEYRIVELPEYGNLTPALGAGASRERFTPFFRNRAKRISLTYVVHFPADYWCIAGRPAKQEWGKYDSSLYQENSTNSPGRFQLNCRLLLPVEYLEAVDHAELERLREKIDRPEARRLIFRRMDTKSRLKGEKK